MSTHTHRFIHLHTKQEETHQCVTDVQLFEQVNSTLEKKVFHLYSVLVMTKSTAQIRPTHTKPIASMHPKRKTLLLTDFSFGAHLCQYFQILLTNSKNKTATVQHTLALKSWQSH